MKKRGNINKYRFIFFEVGLIVALSLSLMAFRIEGQESRFLAEDIVEQEEINIYASTYQAPKKKKKKPKILKRRKTNIDDLRNIKIVKNTIKLVDPFIKKVEPININTAQFVSHTIVQPDALVQQPDKFSEFPGGQKALSKFLGENLRYPDIYVERGKEGYVLASFVVDEYGNITDVKIEKNEVGPICDEEVIRVILKMPKWIPGMKDGENVKTRFYQRIRFELDY